jgi:hypothetical protein
VLAQAGVPLREGPEADAMLTHLRQMYEPFVSALADWLLMPLPSWLPPPGGHGCLESHGMGASGVVRRA